MAERDLVSVAEPDEAVSASPERSLRYCAFISYSHRDEKIADWLHERLEKFRVHPALVGRITDNGAIPARLTPIFRDRQELAASGDLGSVIRGALGSSRFQIVLCSPAAAQSRWVNEEIASFKKLRPDGCVLAAIVAGEPFASSMPGRESKECFPIALRQKVDRRGRPTRRRAEPIAADLREGKDGRRLGLLKIIAGMLGVGLDELVQRETQRRQKRLALLVAASLAGMTVTSTLAMVAVQSRDEAREQRREAEGLVGFMLGDLRAKLEPLGRLDALDAVGGRALAYFEMQDKSDLSDAALTQRSKALTLLGEIASSRGDLDGALRRYREAMTGSAEALRRVPDDPQRIFDHAQNVFWVGDIALQRGQNENAETMMREYRELAEQLVAIDPSKPGWQMERIYADANLGIVLLRVRRYREGAAVFQASLTGIEKLAAGAPRNAEYRKSLIETLAWLADAREQEGRLDDALAQRERQLALLEPLIRTPKSDADNKRQSLVAHRAAGRLLATRGDLTAGLVHLRAAVRIGEELMRTEPDNADWAGLAAGPYLDLGEMLLIAGEIEQAGVSARAGCAIGNRLIERDSSVKIWRVDLRTLCLGIRARLALARGNGEEARGLAGQAAALARFEHRSTPSTETRLALSAAELFRAIIASATDEPLAARVAYRRSLAAWPDGLPLTPRASAQHVLLLDGLGRSDDAERVAGRLEMMGYRHPTYLRDRQLVKTG